MKLFVALFLLLVTTGLNAASKEAPMSIFDFSVKNIHGDNVSLSDYRGKVLLVVNVASQCGFTPQYEGLEALFEKYRERGFMVLGFPSNQFAGQEPGSEQEIYAFCTGTYHVQFDMFAKIDVNGEKAAPLYRYLKKEAPGILGSESIKWNFTKFLVDRDGNVITRYGPAAKPDSIAPDIEALLEK
jgi:glutathione peroxidase